MADKPTDDAALEARKAELIQLIDSRKKAAQLLKIKNDKAQAEHPDLSNPNIAKDLAAAKRFIAAVAASNMRIADIEDMVACRSPVMLQTARNMAEYNQLEFHYRWMSERVEGMFTLASRMENVPRVAVLKEDLLQTIILYRDRLFHPEHGVVTNLSKLWSLDDEFGQALHENFDKAVAAVPPAMKVDEDGQIVFTLPHGPEPRIPETRLPRPVKASDDVK